MFRVQTPPPSPSRLKLLLLLVVLVALSLAALLTIATASQSRFYRHARFNVVLTTKPVSFLSFDVLEKTATLVVFPDDLYIPDVVGGYGPYKISAVFPVGQLDKRGGPVLSESISEYLGVPVDGFIKVDKNFSVDLKKIFLDPRLLPSAGSDLNPLDLANTVFLGVTTPLAKIKIVDLTKIASPLVLADGSTALTIDKEVLDYHLVGLFEEKDIKKDGLRLEVTNTTRVPGLGARVARKITNIGSLVVMVSSSDKKLAGCQLETTQKAKHAPTVKRLSAEYHCQIVPTVAEGRADVTILIGESYVEFLGK